ncbi:MAG: sporulation transcriptional regulator SpoIIID [Clostridiales bacterium]|nr:sporulation transcriptional regulator SpoIIID [Clostridiales bacterium]
MDCNVEKRAILLGEYIARNGVTVRNAAKVFGISKSTVHKDVTQRLEELDPDLSEQVRRILEINKAERHLRGGMATKHKYGKI